MAHLKKMAVTAYRPKRARRSSLFASPAKRMMSGKAQASSAAKASTALVKVNRLNRLLGRMIEKKALTTNLNQTIGSTSTTPTLIEVSGMVEGVGSAARIGLKISPTRLYIDATFGFSTDSYNIVRATLFRWDEETDPTADDILTATNYTNYTQTPINYLEKGKSFTILMDWKGVIVPSTTSQVLFLRRAFSLSGTTQFNGGGATDGVKGRYWLMTSSDSTTVDHPTVSGSVRFQYTDL